MSTREEIEAAVDVVRRYDEVRKTDSRTIIEALGCLSVIGVVDLVGASRQVLADAFVAERAERQRRIEAAAHKIFLTKCQVGVTCADCTERIRDIITRCLDGETT